MNLRGVLGILVKNLHCYLSMIYRSPFSNVPTAFWLTKGLFHKDDLIAEVNVLLHTTFLINKTVLHIPQGEIIH